MFSHEFPNMLTSYRFFLSWRRNVLNGVAVQERVLIVVPNVKWAKSLNVHCLHELTSVHATFWTFANALRTSSSLFRVRSRVQREFVAPAANVAKPQTVNSFHGPHRANVTRILYKRTDTNFLSFLRTTMWTQKFGLGVSFPFPRPRSRPLDERTMFATCVFL